MQTSIWDETIEVCYERGLSIYRNADGAWQTCGKNSLEILSPDIVQPKYGLRPVYAKYQQTKTGNTYSVIFPAFTGRLLNVRLSELQQAVYKRKSASWFLDTQSLFFLLGATNYHCERLSSIYASEVREFAGKPFLRGDTDRVITQTHEVSYEFDSLITAVIRALDSSRYLMWRVFGGSGTTPSSFIRTIRSLSSMPVDFRSKLERSWDVDFSYAKEYRDCIQHYVAAGSRTWCMHYQLEGELWAMWARIPDNPESRSPNAFVFKNKLDALTYAWELTTKLFSMIESLIENAIAVSSSNASKDGNASQSST